MFYEIDDGNDGNDSKQQTYVWTMQPHFEVDLPRSESRTYIKSRTSSFNGLSYQEAEIHLLVFNSDNCICCVFT